MNDTSHTNAKKFDAADMRRGARLPYTAPALQFLGKVAELTQAATGCDNNDNKACAGLNGRQNKN